MQNKYKVELSTKAKNDFKKIIMYIKEELKEPTIALKYANLIKNELKSLEYMPQKYAIVDDENIRNLNVRKLIIKNYIAFYRINENKRVVNVDRILYGTTDWINKL